MTKLQGSSTPTESDGLLPKRDINLDELTDKIIEAHGLPDRIDGVRRVTVSVRDIVRECLEYRADSQYREAGNEWRYIYDPLTVEVWAIIVAIKDTLRISLGCDQWGCRTMADLQSIAFEDGQGNSMDEWMKQKEEEA